MKSLLLILALSLGFSFCTKSQKVKFMKSTANKLISYLKNCDSSSLLLLYANIGDQKDEILYEFKKDCKRMKNLFQSNVLLKNPTYFHKVENGFNVIEISLLQKKDTVLGLKSVILKACFPENKYIFDTAKIIYYVLIITKINKSGDKFINKIPKSPITATIGRLPAPFLHIQRLQQTGSAARGTVE